MKDLIGTEISVGDKVAWLYRHRSGSSSHRTDFVVGTVDRLTKCMVVIGNHKTDPDKTLVINKLLEKE